MYDNIVFFSKTVLALDLFQYKKYETCEYPNKYRLIFTISVRIKVGQYTIS